jgi:hypothetical protein
MLSKVLFTIPWEIMLIGMIKTALTWVTELSSFWEVVSGDTTMLQTGPKKLGLLLVMVEYLMLVERPKCITYLINYIRML